MDNKDHLQHYGVLGMKWGVRRYQNTDGSLKPAGRKQYSDGGGKSQTESKTGNKKTSNAVSNVKQKVTEARYAVGNTLHPKEMKYKVKRTFNKTTDTQKRLVELEQESSRKSGLLTTKDYSLKAIEKEGIERHKNTKYDNLDDTDIERFKKYTDAAVYSRAVNGYLATGSPKEVEQKAKELKESIQKNKVSDQTVYRSCNLKFSTDGLAKKLDTYGEDELSTLFDSMSSNFQNKTVGENRIYSTSTSPLFAIDTWRKVNPTAAKTYNSYLVIDCKETPGIYADARTTKGKSLVNTKSNQEVILAPNEMVYKKMSYDKEREMFAIHMDAR